MLDDRALLAMASAFTVFNDYASKQYVRVELRPHPGTNDQTWVITNEAKFVLNRDGQWEFDPILTGGTEDFVDFTARTRWDDAVTAIEAAQQAIAQSATPAAD